MLFHYRQPLLKFLRIRLTRRNNYGLKWDTSRFINGEPVTSNDYVVTYGSNFEAGKKKGAVTITLIRNSVSKEFKKGGTKTFFFDITPAPGVTL